jgi:hypothetical protein
MVVLFVNVSIRQVFPAPAVHVQSTHLTTFFGIILLFFEHEFDIEKMAAAGKYDFVKVTYFRI